MTSEGGSSPRVAARQPKSWLSTYRDGATYIGHGIVAGLISGAVIGGIGGRLAMFVLRLTSDASLRGRETDDEFIIGSFTGDTVFLVFITALAGFLGGLLYLAVREWLPYRWRPVLFGLLGATLGGTLAINPGGLDFTLLEPLLLAVAMFVALPAIYGVAVSLLTERLIRAGGARGAGVHNWAWVSALPLLFILGAGPPGIAVFILSVVLIGANRDGRIAALWRSMPVVRLGRGLFAAAVIVSAYFLVDDVTAVL